MPLLVAVTEPVLPEEPPPPAPHTPILGITWTAPDGTVTDLMDWRDGPILLQDLTGFGAAPRVVTRQGLLTGGSYGRWSHADERILGIPLLTRADDVDRFMELRRALTLAFTQTAPAAGEPRLGVLRVTRRDGTWREISAIYESGLDWNESGGSGTLFDTPVIQLVAPDAWWYGEERVAVEFLVEPGRDYLDPYGTVSPDAVLGATTIFVDGDVDVSPIWTITGPATEVHAEIVGGPSWTYGPIAAGRTVTVDTSRPPNGPTVTDDLGVNRIAGLDWPSSTLFQLPTGFVDIQVDLVGGNVGPPPSGVRLSYRPRRETA